MNLRTGVDLIELERVENTIQRHGERFLERVFTSQELVEAGENVASLAARFAAKEATAKALGTGFRDGVFWRWARRNGGCTASGLPHWTTSAVPACSHA